ncbi:MAG: glycosyltransferase, partial [Burkholderiales bacterium]
MALRILHVGKFYPPDRGGMETFLAHLVAAQRAQGIDSAALVHGTPAPEDPPWLVRVPVQFQLVYAPIAVGFRAALARAIKQFRPDVLHLHMPNNSALWVLTLPQARALPWVVHWHSDVVVSQIKWSVAAAYALYRPFEHAVLDGAECIIATSEPYLRASAPLRHWRHKCAVVPIGLDTSDLPDAVVAAGAAKAGWHPDTQLRLLSIGRLTYYKGFETLIQALRTLPGVELLIAGEGELHATLQALIASSAAAGQRPAVRLLGNVT